MRYVVGVIASVLPLVVWAKNPTISGYVLDAKTGERLIGATVMDRFSGAGTVTNVNGFYSLTLPSDSVQLQAGYVGYEAPSAMPFMLHGDTLVEMPLTASNVLDEIVVAGKQSLSSPHSVQMSVVEVPVSQIKGIPAIGGEVDIIKAIQLLPGVQSGSEGASGLYVRGGGPDENLIMLDGVPLYSVNHMFGFFSVFNADAVKNVALYEGNFPARFAGRLSSIIDVRQKDGDAYGYHGSLTVGIVSTKLSVEGPIYWTKEDWRRFRNKEKVKAQTTFVISARRTLYDLLALPVTTALSASKSNGDSISTGGYYFYDVNAKLTHTFSADDKLSASFYMGDDVVYNRIRNTHPVNPKQPTFMRMRYNWGNIFGAVQYEHRFNGRLYSTHQVSCTRYKYKLKLKETDQLKENTPYPTEREAGYNSYILDLTAQTHFEWRPNARNEVHFGAHYTWHTFRPQVGHFLVNASVGQLDTTISVGGTVHTHEAGVYLEDTYSPCTWFKGNAGLHAGLYHTEGKTYYSFEPRVGLRFLPHKDVALKASYAYMTQYVHMLSNSSVSMPTDLWVPVTATVPPMRSMQVAAGITYNICNQVELSVEGYYKKMLNLLEYKDGASYMDGMNWQTQVVIGDGWSYGVQLLAKRTVGALTGWIGYTWSRTMRQFDKPGQELNFGKPFHAKYDREHDLSVTLQYKINKQWEIAGTFVYGTGTRGTLPLQRYSDWLYGEIKQPGKGAVTEVNYMNERNNFKMPDYHRLDLSATCHLPDKKHADWDHILNISVYNVYCRLNPFLVYPREGKLYKFSLLPILPSLSYTFKF